MAMINHSVVVPVPPDRAYQVFTDGLASWWPAEHTWSGSEALAAIGIERGAGGLCYEIGPHGFRCDWGRVLVWDPPRRLVFSWQVGPQREPVPDPDRASEVEVRFDVADEGGTRVALEHRGFERHGPGGDEYRRGMSSAQGGWPYLLERFAKTFA